MDDNNTASNKENMGRRFSLTKEKKGKIAALSLAETSTKEVARAVVERKNAVQNYLKFPAAQGVKKGRVCLKRWRQHQNGA